MAWFSLKCCQTAQQQQQQQQQHTTTTSNSPTILRIDRAIRLGRLLFVLCLGLTAVALAWASHHFLAESERKLADAHFESVADRTLTETAHSLLAKRWATITMAAVTREMLPDANVWPYVAVPGFERIVKHLLNTTSSEDMAMAVVVNASELSTWEDFAYRYYYEQRQFPNTTAVSSFGRGVWKLDPQQQQQQQQQQQFTTDGRVRDFGVQTYPTKYNIVTPIFHVDEGVDPVLMFNLHSEQSRGAAIDHMLDCVAQGEHVGMKCGVILGMVELRKFQTRGPTSPIYQPIRPAHDPFQVTGIIASALVWDELLENVFSHDVSGVDCVLTNQFEAYTYSIEQGRIAFHQSGDHHDPAFDSHRRSVLLTPNDFFLEGSPSYHLTLYPTESFYDGHQTNNPCTASIGAIAIILLTSVFFFLYDSCVRKEFMNKKDLLEAKRRFMRFVSHEVRTPLNAVCMGLDVLQHELKQHDPAGPVSNPAQPRTRSSRAIKEDKEETHPVFPVILSAEKTHECMKLVKDVQTSAQCAVDVLNDVLNYDKVERRALSLEITIIPVWWFLEKTIDEFRLPAANKKITLSWKFGATGNIIVFSGSSPNQESTQAVIDRLPPNEQQMCFVGDAFRLKQVTRNLLSNAIKFTSEKGSVRVEVSIEQGKESRSWETLDLKGGEHAVVKQIGMCRVKVIDTGVGMTSTQIKNVFGEGVQFNPNELQNGQGSGLGLFITKGIVEHHNGKIGASSGGIGKGTTLNLTLPVYHLDDRLNDCSSPFTSSVSVSDATEAFCHILNILIVEDVATNRKLLRKLLERKGHTCEEAENGLLAVDMVRDSMEGERRPFDVILMDYEMPVMDGPTAAREIRQLAKDRHFIIGVTGNTMTEDVNYFCSSGANAVLPKPVKIASLEDVWKEYAIKPHSQVP